MKLSEVQPLTDCGVFSWISLGISLHTFASADQCGSRVIGRTTPKETGTGSGPADSQYEPAV